MAMDVMEIKRKESEDINKKTLSLQDSQQYFSAVQETLAEIGTDPKSMRDNAANEIKFDEGKKIAKSVLASLQSVQLDQTFFQEIFGSSTNSQKKYMDILSEFGNDINSTKNISELQNVVSNFLNTNKWLFEKSSKIGSDTKIKIAGKNNKASVEWWLESAWEQLNSLTTIGKQEVREIYRNDLILEDNSALADEKESVEGTRKALNDHIDSIHGMKKQLITKKSTLEWIKNEIVALDKDLKTKNETAGTITTNNTDIKTIESTIATKKTEQTTLETEIKTLEETLKTEEWKTPALTTSYTQAQEKYKVAITELAAKNQTTITEHQSTINERITSSDGVRGLSESSMSTQREIFGLANTTITQTTTAIETELKKDWASISPVALTEQHGKREEAMNKRKEAIGSFEQSYSKRFISHEQEFYGLSKSAEAEYDMENLILSDITTQYNTITDRISKTETEIKKILEDEGKIDRKTSKGINQIRLFVALRQSLTQQIESMKTEQTSIKSKMDEQDKKVKELKQKKDNWISWSELIKYTTLININTMIAEETKSERVIYSWWKWNLESTIVWNKATLVELEEKINIIDTEIAKLPQTTQAEIDVYAKKLEEMERLTQQKEDITNNKLQKELTTVEARIVAIDKRLGWLALDSWSYGNSLDKYRKQIQWASSQDILTKFTNVTASAPKILEASK